MFFNCIKQYARITKENNYTEVIKIKNKCVMIKSSSGSKHDCNCKVMMNTYNILKFLQLEGDIKAVISIGDSHTYC